MDTLVIQGGRPLRGTLHVGGSKNTMLPAHGRGRPRRRRHDDPQRARAPRRAHVLERAPRDGLPRLVRARRRPGHAGRDDDRRARPAPLRGAVRPRQQDAGVVLHARRAARARRQGQGVAARRLRLGPAPRGPPPQGDGGARRRDHRGTPRLRLRVERPAAGSPAARSASSRPRVGATINFMLAAVTAEGESRIENAAAEPDVVVFGQMLQQMGADIAGLGTDTITIQGVERMNAVDFTNCPDRIELGTYMIAAAIAAEPGETVRLTGANPDHLGDAFLDAFRADGRPVHARRRHGRRDGRRGHPARLGRGDALPRLPDRPAGAVDGHDDAGRGPVDGPRRGLHGPLQAHPRAAPAGRGRPRRGRHGPRRRARRARPKATATASRAASRARR